MILQTSIFFLSLEPLLVADVPPAPVDVEPELLPQPASTTSAATATAAPIRAFGRMII
jgi:hypothetical protein